MGSKLIAVIGAIAIAFLLATNPVVADAAKQITGKNIKNNTVTTKDIKNNNLTGKDVKDGALKASDFKAGELPYTRAYQFEDSGTVSVTSNTVIGELDLPKAGTYVITSKTRFNSSAAAEIYVGCTLTDGVVNDTVETGFGEDAGEDDYRTIGSVLATTITGPKTITWSCTSSTGASMQTYNRRIVAVKVASLN